MILVLRRRTLRDAPASASNRLKRVAKCIKLTNKFCFLVAKGQSANMLKISSKRRRTLAQIKADKEAAAQKEAENEARI